MLHVARAWRLRLATSLSIVVYNNQVESRDLCVGKRVCELGAGCGLPSLALAACLQLEGKECDIVVTVSASRVAHVHVCVVVTTSFRPLLQSVCVCACACA